MTPDHHFTAHLEAFGEPRTFPSGWNLSGMQSAPPSGNGGHAPDPQPRHPTQPQTPASPDGFEHVHGYSRHWNLTCLI